MQDSTEKTQPLHAVYTNNMYDMGLAIQGTHAGTQQWGSPRVYGCSVSTDLTTIECGPGVPSAMHAYASV